MAEKAVRYALFGILQAYVGMLMEQILHLKSKKNIISFIR